MLYKDQGGCSRSPPERSSAQPCCPLWSFSQEPEASHLGSGEEGKHSWVIDLSWPEATCALEPQWPVGSGLVLTLLLRAPTQLVPGGQRQWKVASRSRQVLPGWQGWDRHSL